MTAPAHVLAPDARRSFRSEAAPMPGSTRRTVVRRVLVVDESPTIRLTAADLLGRAGVPDGDVQVADSPEAGLAAFRDSNPSVVLIEVDAEGGDGLAVALEMLKLNPRVRLVVLTSRGRDCERVRRLVRAGAFDVIEKPLRHDKIRALLSDLQVEDGGIERLR